MRPEDFNNWRYDFDRAYEEAMRSFNQQKWTAGTYSEPKPLTPKQDMIYGLMLGDVYNRFAQFEVWDWEKRIRLPEAVKSAIREFIRTLHKRQRFFESTFVWVGGGYE